MSFPLINEDQAKTIAGNFLQQHYSVIKIVEIILEDGIWLVNVLVEPPNRIIKVKVNAKTGWILGYQ